MAVAAIRIDPTSDAPLGIPANIWASFVAIALGIILIVVQTRRHPAPETSVYRTGREPEVLSTPATEVDQLAPNHPPAGSPGNVA